MQTQSGFAPIQIILSILAGTIVLGSVVGGVLYFSKSKLPAEQIRQDKIQNQNKCGDGVCDSIEEEKRTCPKDCAQISDTETKNSRASDTASGSNISSIDITDTSKSYVSFGVNINDYYEHSRSADTVSRLIDIYTKYNIKADLYFTAPVLKSFETYHPELIEKIKKSKMSINYHFRPPHPAYDAMVQQAKDANGQCRILADLSYDEIKKILSNFEKYELKVDDYVLNKKNYCSSYDSDKTGGYKYVASVFGMNPVISAVSNIKDADIKKAEAKVLEESGSKMLVVGHFGNTKDSINTPFEKTYDLPDRPSDYGGAFVEMTTAHGKDIGVILTSPVAAESFLKQKKDIKLSRASFGVFVVHDYDFYNSKGWDYPATDKSSLLRTTEQTESAFKNYEEAVKKIVADGGVKTVSADDIAYLYENGGKSTKSATSATKNTGTTSTAASPAYVLITQLGGKTLYKVDTATDKIVAQVNAGSGRPAVDPKRRLIYLPSVSGGFVAIKADTFETATVAVSGMGKGGMFTSISPDGKTLAIVNAGSDGARSSDDRVDIITVNPDVWPPTATLKYSFIVGQQPIRALIDHNGRYAVVSVRDDPTPQILVLDLSTSQIALKISLSAGSEPEGMDIHPSENIVYVTLHGKGKESIEIIDLSNTAPSHAGSVAIKSTKGSPQPSGGNFTLDGSRFYVSAQATNEVLLFNAADVKNPVQDTKVSLSSSKQPHDIAFFSNGKAYVANTYNANRGTAGSISVISNYSGTPSISSTVLSEIKNPLYLVSLPNN